MKRDPDVIRSILLLVEQTPAGEFTSNFDSVPSEHAILVEHIKLLQDAGFVEARIGEYSGGLSAAVILRMTSAGHDFLDKVRDPDIWRKTKEKVHKAGGFSLELLGIVAKGLIKDEVARHTGFKLD